MKRIILLCLVALSMQKDHLHDEIPCFSLLQPECELAVNCMWHYQGVYTGCTDAIYVPLGKKRIVEQEIMFSKRTDCSSKIHYGSFIARKSFTNKKFQGWCNWLNVYQIKIGEDFYKEKDQDGKKVNLPPKMKATEAIIYPIAPKGTAYLYSRQYYRGDTWMAYTHTKLNGQVIRSIMLGQNVRVSLYDNGGDPIKEYQGITFDNDFMHIYPDIYTDWMIGIDSVTNANKIEYILLEKFFGYDDPNSLKENP